MKLRERDSNGIYTVKSNVDFILAREQALEQERHQRDEQNKDKNKNSLE